MITETRLLQSESHDTAPLSQSSEEIEMIDHKVKTHYTLLLLLLGVFGGRGVFYGRSIIFLVENVIHVFI